MSSTKQVRFCERLNVQAPADLCDSVRRASMQRGESVSVLVREAIRQYLADPRSAPAAAQRGGRS